MITIHRSHEDDPGFIDQTQWIVAGCIDQYKPVEIYVVGIRDWFDYKWCGFTGKTLGALGVWNNDLTLPPFVPGRVISQEHYQRCVGDGGIYEESDAAPLHIHQPSEANFKRYARKAVDNGTLIWFSSGSIATGRGSIMVYNVTPDTECGWHVMFQRKRVWQIERVTNISKTVVEMLRDAGTPRCSVKITR